VAGALVVGAERKKCSGDRNQMSPSSYQPHLGLHRSFSHNARSTLFPTDLHIVVLYHQQGTNLGLRLTHAGRLKFNLSRSTRLAPRTRATLQISRSLLYFRGILEARMGLSHPETNSVSQHGLREPCMPVPGAATHDGWNGGRLGCSSETNVNIQ
jgi:hypothetical protein